MNQTKLFGGLDYSMRIWFDTARLTSLNVAPSDIVKAIQSQNVQASIGRIGARPVPENQQFRLLDDYDAIVSRLRRVETPPRRNRTHQIVLHLPLDRNGHSLGSTVSPGASDAWLPRQELALRAFDNRLRRYGAALRASGRPEYPKALRIPRHS
jgi:hypothetical protein